MADRGVEMARNLVLFMLSVCCALAPAWAAQPELGIFQAREIAPGIHLLGTPADYSGPAVGNMTIVEQKDGLVVLDSGATIGHGRTLVAYIRSISPKPVKLVSISHWHNDHPLGVAAIREAWPKVRIVSTAATRSPGCLGSESWSPATSWSRRSRSASSASPRAGSRCSSD